MSGIKVAKCCYFMGIFSAVLYALLTGIGVALFLHSLYYLLFSTPPDNIYIAVGGAVVLLNFGAISFGFSVVLVIGIRKKNQKYIKSYFIYIYAVAILCIIATVTYWCVVKEAEIIISAIAVTICGYHLTMTILAFKTFQFISCRRIPTDNLLIKNQNQLLYYIEAK